MRVIFPGIESPKGLKSIVVIGVPFDVDSLKNATVEFAPTYAKLSFVATPYPPET